MYNYTMQIGFSIIIRKFDRNKVENILVKIATVNTEQFG